MPEYRDQFRSPTASIPKFKDSILLGLLGGFFGTMSLDLANLFSRKNKKNETLYGRLTGSILTRGVNAKKSSTFIFGQFIHMVTGALTGIPLVYLLKKTGRDHQIIKGGAYGTLVWAFYYVLGIKSGMFNTRPKQNKVHVASFWQNILFGVTTSQAIVSLAHPSVFRKQDLKLANPKRPVSNIPTWGLPQYTDKKTEKIIH
jgi:hypothetical protein